MPENSCDPLTDLRTANDSLTGLRTAVDRYYRNEKSCGFPYWYENSCGTTYWYENSCGPTYWYENTCGYHIKNKAISRAWFFKKKTNQFICWFTDPKKFFLGPRGLQGSQIENHCSRTSCLQVSEKSNNSINNNSNNSNNKNIIIML